MIELRDVEFKVDSPNGELEIIDKINLKIESGKFIVITGPNGGGKSTLAKLIMGIEKPTGGKILLTAWILRICRLMKGQSLVSAMASRLRPDLRGLRCVSC